MPVKKTETIKSYGKFKEFEIREVTSLSAPCKNPRFDLVKWVYDSDKPYCYSIGFLEYNPNENSFEFYGVGLRYQEDSTTELNKWIIKWCELKAYELKNESEL